MCKSATSDNENCVTLIKPIGPVTLAFTQTVGNVVLYYKKCV